MDLSFRFSPSDVAAATEKARTVRDDTRCACIVIHPEHDHTPGWCERRPMIRGGICRECHDWRAPAEEE